MSTQRLETERLLLLPWNSADWHLFKPIATDPAVMRYISDGFPWSDERIIEFVEKQRRQFVEFGYCLWKLVLKRDGRLGGFCGIQPLDDLPGIEIGWWLAHDLWGQGLASEAARAALKDGFGRVGLTRMVAIALRENQASLRVMEKLGMHYEREAEHHGFRVVLYSIDNKDSYVWSCRRETLRS